MQFLTVLAFALLVTLGAPSAHAQGVGVRVQPSTIEESADPGTALEGAVTVTNENGGEQTFSISVRTITGMDDSGRPIFGEDTQWSDEFTAAAWVHPLVNAITLGVGQSGQVPYRIEIPADASPGSYFAAIFVTRKADEVSETGAGVGFNVASLISLRVHGDVKEDLSIREFSTDSTVYGSPEAQFKLRLENPGTVHQRPRGVITLTNMLGREVALIPLNDTNGAILPRTDRVFPASWSGGRFAVGRFAARASVSYGEGSKRTIERETVFWVLPWKEIGMVLGGIIGALLLVGLMLRAYVRSVLRKAGHDPKASARTARESSLARRMFRTATWLVVLLVAFGFVAALLFA